VLSSYVLAVIKLTVFLACLWIGYHYLTTHQINWNHINLSKLAPMLMPLCLGLTIINWSLEARKWQILMCTLEPITLRKSLRASLSGVATSFITPFRIGDFAGRVVHVPNQKRNATVLTFFANFAQMIATLFFGILSLSLIKENPFLTDTKVFIGLIIIGWVMIAALILCMLVPKAMFSFKWFDQLSIKTDIFDLPIQLTSKVLSLSLIRYLVFLTQFIISFKLFGSDLPFYDLAILISILYLLMTFIPGPILGKLGVRESVGLFLIGPFEESAIIVAASLFIWIINLFIPAIIGAINLRHIKFFRN